MSSRVTASPECYPRPMCVSQSTLPRKLTLLMCSLSRSRSCRPPTPCLPSPPPMREVTHRSNRPLPRDVPPAGEGLPSASIVVMKTVSALIADTHCDMALSMFPLMTRRSWTSALVEVIAPHPPLLKHLGFLSLLPSATLRKRRRGSMGLTSHTRQVARAPCAPLSTLRLLLLLARWWLAGSVLKNLPLPCVRVGWTYASPVLSRFAH